MITFPSHKWLTSALWALPLHATWDDLPVLRHEDYEGLRIFIYDLPDIFHKEWHSYLELMARNAGSNCDWMLSHCTETSSAGKFSIYRQLGQEVIILRKLLAGPTVPPEEADIFVVPALIGSACFSGLYSSRCSGPADGFPTDLHSRLPYYNSVTRHRHLFLASLDKRNLPLSVQAQTLLVSMGASYGSVGHFVVPLAVTDQEPPPKPRTTLVYLAMVPNNHFRQLIYSQLEALSQAELLNLNRSRTELHNIPTSNLIISAMGSAMFCVCPPAENSAAGSKRLYDAIFAGCVPVVISFPTAWGSGISWWRTDGAPLEFAMPFPWEIDWRRLAVEVSEDELLRGELGARLANFPMTEFLEKQSYLLKVRRLLLYDMNGGQRDAFSVLMEGIRNALPSLYSMGGQPIICETIPLSHGWLGRQLDKKWSSSFGELACSAQSFWRRSSAFWTSAQANTKVTIEPLRVSQFQLKKVDAGLYFYQATSYIVEGHSQPGSLAICENADFPEALHESGPQGPRSLRDSTACRYAAALGASSAVQLVMPLCNSEPLATSQSLNLAMQEFFQQLPGQPSVQVMAYDTCTDLSGGVANPATASLLAQHLHAVKLAQERGAASPEIFLLFAGATPSEGLLSHEVIDSLVKYRTEMADVLVVFDGLREPGLLCDPFTELFHKHCPVTEELAAFSPLAVAFSRALLRRVALVDLELVASQVFTLHEQVDLVTILMYKAMLAGGTKGLHLESFRPSSERDTCVDAWTRGEFWHHSGFPLCVGNSILEWQASSCEALGGEFSIVETG
ncbi:unnamed protein product, partial [Effrenium voratum]